MPAKSSPRGRPELEGRREPFFRPNRGSWAARVPEWRRTEAIYSRDLNIELLEPDDSSPLQLRKNALRAYSLETYLGGTKYGALNVALRLRRCGSP